MLGKLFRKIKDKTINESVYDEKKVIEKNKVIEEQTNEKNDFADIETIQNEDKQNAIEDNIVKEENEIVEYQLPPITLLKRNNSSEKKISANYLVEKAKELQQTLYSFGISAKVEDVIVGPNVTTYAVKLADGVSINKIKKLNDDLALNLATKNVNIDIIPEKQLVGIQVERMENDCVNLSEIISSEEFEYSQSKLTVGLGKDIYGQNRVIDINKTSHMIISGTTGSGKSVFLHTIINSILYKATPTEVKFIMIDTKVVELSIYNGIPHMLIPVVTDNKKVVGVLAWIVKEIEERYNLFGIKEIKSIEEYNKQEDVLKLPNIVIIVDEYADLLEYDKKEIQEFIYRITQRAKNVGIFLILATERPSINVINGTIKANMPTRVSFRLPSQIDSKVVLDTAGAEKLLGNGDMLFKEIGVFEPVRYQGAFISSSEIEKIVDFIKTSQNAVYSVNVLDYIEKGNDKFNKIAIEEYEDDTDPLLMEAMDVVVETGQASTSFIQRRFKVGYARAGRIIDQLEERGIISGYQGDKPRQVLMTMERLNELKNMNN